MTAHKHATNMLQYALDAATTDKPWEWWECKLPGYRGFMPMINHPLWVADGEYRRRAPVKFNVEKLIVLNDALDEIGSY